MTTNYFDTSGRLWKTTLPDNTSVTNEFFATGLLKKTYGSRTYPVEYTYDAQGRMQTMKTWRDFAGNSGTATTTWNYNAYRGWLDNKRYPLLTGEGQGEGTDYTYTSAGRLKSRAWARGVTTWYTNNPAGDLWVVNHLDATPDVTYTYDRRGRQTTIGAGGLTTTLAYNNASQLLSETYSGGVLNGLAVTNAYDAYLRRSAVGLKTQPATLTHYGYDQTGRLAGVTNGNYTAAYSYLANAPLVSQIAFRSNTVTRMTTTRSYDFLNRLTDIASSAGAAPVSRSAYAYNTANQRTAITNADNGRWVYTYDALGQVTSGKKYWSDGTPVAGQQFEYGFDDIGNRKQTKAGGDENGSNLRPANYTNNTLNQITSRGVPGYVEVLGLALVTNTVTVNGQGTYRKGEYFRKEWSVNNSSAPVWTNLSVAAPGETTVAGNVLVARTPQTFTHDFDGNLINDGLWTNVWNAENRLLRTESLTSVPTAARAREEWTYLPDGRWIQRIVSTNNGAAYYPAYTNRYVWDGQILLAILDHTNGLVMSFMRGLDLSGSLQGAGGVGGVLAVSFKTNGAHFCAYDGNGNVTALVSAANGSASARYEYGPFGETIRMTGPVAKLNPIRFSTQYADDVSGDVKYLFRDYDSETGRWLSRDPIKERGGQNLYGFVRNDPIRLWDIFGLECCLITYKRGDDGSFDGHSILTCGDNDIYISHWPTEKDGPWHNPEKDAEYYPTSIPTKICTDCLDESKLRDWFNKKRASGDKWKVSYNCADAVREAIVAGLPPSKQIKPDCGKCTFLERLAGGTKYARDVLTDSDGGAKFPYSRPSDLHRGFKELIDNGCNRWQCTTRFPTNTK